MPPLLLVTTLIINSNYGIAPVSHKSWMPNLSMTIVLIITITCNFEWKLSTPKEHLEEIVGGQDREDVDREKQTRIEGRYCYEMYIE